MIVVTEFIMETETLCGEEGITDHHISNIWAILGYLFSRQCMEKHSYFRGIALKDLM